MRFLILPTFTILAGGLLLAADPQTVTYIDGTVADLSPNTGATLYFNTPQTMELRTPLHSVEVPYARIVKAEMGSIVEHSYEAEPPYKVWSLPKRLIKTEGQEMTFAFTNESGQSQTMTIEMPKKAAAKLFATIKRRNGRVAESNWWGSGYWKTTRNQDQWNAPSTIAQK